MAVSESAEVRRRIAHLVWLLELADQELTEIREELQHFEKRADELTGDLPATAPISKASLAAFVALDFRITELDYVIGNTAGVVVMPPAPFIDEQVPWLRRAGVETIGQLGDFLTERAEELQRFCTFWWTGNPGVADHVRTGVSLFYIAMAYAVSQGGRKALEHLLLAPEGWSSGSLRSADRLMTYARHAGLTAEDLG